MKILKKYILILMVLFISSSGILIAQGKVFFRDTVFENAGLKIKFEQGIGGSEVVKIKVLITNLTDRYAYIDPKDIVVNLINGTERVLWHDKPIVVPPKDLTKATLQFRGLVDIGKAPLNLSFKSIKFADTLLKSYNPLMIEPKFGLKYQDKGLAFEIIEVTPRAEDYAVKLEINYSGLNFLSINYNKALFVTAKGDFHNNRKSKSYYSNNLPSQKMLMIFPCSEGKGFKIPGAVNLNEVFKEYSMKATAGFNIKLGFITEKEFLDNKRGKKEEVIEEIE